VTSDQKKKVLLAAAQIASVIVQNNSQLTDLETATKQVLTAIANTQLITNSSTNAPVTEDELHADAADILATLQEVIDRDSPPATPPASGGSTAP
jgi:hypothetical protein